jgi:hypothetical protein
VQHSHLSFHCKNVGVGKTAQQEMQLCYSSPGKKYIKKRFYASQT